MEPNLKLKAAFLTIVDNQLRDNTPPEARETFNRLLAEGYSAEEARELIGSAIGGELYEMLKYGQPYNQDRYLKALCRLPKQS